MDLSKVDPKVLMELSQLVQQLPPQQLNRMQSLMHNMMAGHDVTRDMAEFEQTLPAGFREKLVAVMGTQGFAGVGVPTPAMFKEPIEMDLRGARVTILRGIADGSLAPEEAERLLFPQG